MAKKTMIDYEYRVTCRKPGRPGGYTFNYTDFPKALALFQQKTREGFIVSMKQRKIGDWEEVRNPCEDEN